MVRSIGADRVIDYTQQDFTRNGQRYDVLFDVVGNHSLLASRRALNSGGRYISVGGPAGRWMIGALARPIAAVVLSKFVSQSLGAFLARPNNKDLDVLRELLATGKLTPVIDRRYGLSEVAEAIRYLEQGHARGKVLITLGA